jgi:sensor histidine kinase YesM
MNIPFDKDRINLYLKIGSVYLAMSLFGNLVMDPSNFLPAGLMNELWMAIFIFAMVYFFYEYIFQKISTKEITISIVLIFAQLFIITFGMYIWRKIGIGLSIFTPLKTYPHLGKALGDQLGDSIGALLFFGIVRHIYFYRKLKKTAQQLRIEKQEAELNYLKSQTNPHFLFNTLNNIYSLARDKSDLAPESILRLSKILRFMLYEAGGNFISIEKELKIITDYVELEKLRYDESLQVNFNYDVEDMKQSLPPLLLIPLVENAFKHGVSETRNRPFVDIHLSVNMRQLKFVVKNSADGTGSEQPIVENIGLSNLRRQLQLLYKEYSLDVLPGETVFTSTLKINLASHV